MAKAYIKRFLGYFFNGVLISVPLVVTGYILYKMFVFFDSVIPLEKKPPGLGLLILLLSLTAIGILGTSLIFKPFHHWFNKFLERVPLIKTIYSTFNDLVGAFVGQKKKFSRPVLVLMDKELKLERIGFVTDDDAKGLLQNNDKVAVYFPLSYSLSGNLWIVPAEHITPIDLPAADVMKYVISGGVTETEGKA